MDTKTLRMLAVASLALLLACSAYGVLWYLVGERGAVAAARASNRTASGTRQLELAALKVALTESAEDRARLHELVISDDRLTEFLALVENGARAQGLTAETRSVDIANPAGRFEELRIVLDVEGGYAGLKRLIALFETMPFHIDMEDVALERSEGERWHGVFTFSVTKERIR